MPIGRLFDTELVQYQVPRALIVRREDCFDVEWPAECVDTPGTRFGSGWPIGHPGREAECTQRSRKRETQRERESEREREKERERERKKESVRERERASAQECPDARIMLYTQSEQDFMNFTDAKPKATVM